MRTPENSEVAMARINGVLLRSAVVIAVAAAILLPLVG